MKTYQVIDRGYDYVLIYDNGFAQRCPNVAILRRAVRNARRLGYRRVI